MLIKKDSIFLIIVCLVFFVIANIYNLKTEIFNAPDEFGHFEYIRFLNLNQHFPTLTERTDFWEAHQPPLYYLVLSPVDLVLKNRIFIENEVKLLRFFSSLLGVLTVVFAFLTARILFNGKRLIYYSLTLAFCLWPMFLFISGVLNNDVMANLIGMVMIYYLIKYNMNAITNNANLRTTNMTLFVCGVVADLAFLTKLVLWPVTVFFLAAIFWFSRNIIRNYLKFCFMPAFIILIAWLLRNLIFVGDVLGLKFANKFWTGQHRDLLVLNNMIDWLKDLSKSFLGTFGYANIGLEPRYYKYFLYFIGAIIILLPMVFIFYWFKDKKLFENLIISGCFFAIIFLTTFYYSLENFQPQGRYMLAGLFSFLLYIVSLLAIIFFRKIRFILPVLIVLVFGWLNFDAFKHINWVNAHPKIVLENEKNNLFLRQWKAKSGKWKKENNYYVYKKNKEKSFLLSYPNLRLNTNRIKRLIVKLRTNDFEQFKISWRYVGDQDFWDKNSLNINIENGRNWKIYKFDFKDLKRNDLVQIVKFEFFGKDEGRADFDTIRAE